MSWLDATSVTRLKTSSLIRCTRNALTEVDAMNRCARFPALVRRRAPAFALCASARKPHGGGCPAGLAGCPLYLVSPVQANSR
jgi:hypothetical protein